jgi:hypothetical protein
LLHCWLIQWLIRSLSMLLKHWCKVLHEVVDCSYQVRVVIREAHRVRVIAYFVLYMQKHIVIIFKSEILYCFLHYLFICLLSNNLHYCWLWWISKE